jgi:methylenetetrahydrofolate--tRNA-(uracil-5-)-methyltransferase
MKNKYLVVGAGLAGCEAAFALAEAGNDVHILEMKPKQFSPAHQSPNFAELVCSNSFRSSEITSGIGLLQAELQDLGSLVLAAAKAHAVPAGKALAVDREGFAAWITDRIRQHSCITVHCLEVTAVPRPEDWGVRAVILAPGPLVSDPLAEDLARVVGSQHLAFYDAIAPIVATDSVDMDVAYWACRRDPHGTDYLNLPLTEAEYFAFVQALRSGETVPARSFEDERHFEGCLPIEVMAARGDLTLAFGPMKPVGLPDPRTGREPFAVVQLRPENREKTACNMVGFQTKLTYPEQRRIFSMLPGMAQVEFLRLGSMHRNTFVDAPRVLTPTLELRDCPGVYVVGQLSGVEGYVESAATGLWVGLVLAGRLPGLPPRETALGALLSHVQRDVQPFQPSNIHFGLMPALPGKHRKRARKELYAQHARAAFACWLAESGF